MFPVIPVPPLKLLRTGVVEVDASPSSISVTDSPARAIRWIVHESTRPGMLNTAAQRINTLQSNGIHPLLCLGDAGYSSSSNLANDVYDIFSQVNKPGGLWLELINEPGQDLGGSVTAQSNRDAYLGKIFGTVTAAGKWTGAKTPLQVAHLFGVKNLLSASTGKTGGTAALLDDLVAGSQGADPAQIDGCALHSYNAEPSDVLATYISSRNMIDARAGMKRKPIIATEIGWMCSTRADGSGNTGCPTTFPGCDWKPGTSNWQGNPRTITQAQQADKITNGSTGIIDLVALHPELLMLGIYVFGHQDYGIPTGQHFNHTGAKDFAGGKRTLWTRLQAAPSSVLSGHFH